MIDSLMRSSDQLAARDVAIAVRRDLDVLGAAPASAGFAALAGEFADACGVVPVPALTA